MKSVIEEILASSAIVVNIRVKMKYIELLDGKKPTSSSSNSPSKFKKILLVSLLMVVAIYLCCFVNNGVTEKTISIICRCSPYLALGMFYLIFFSIGIFIGVLLDSCRRAIDVCEKFTDFFQGYCLIAIGAIIAKIGIIMCDIIVAFEEVGYDIFDIDAFVPLVLGFLAQAWIKTVIVSKRTDRNSSPLGYNEEIIRKQCEVLGYSDMEKDQFINIFLADGKLLSIFDTFKDYLEEGIEGEDKTKRGVFLYGELCQEIEEKIMSNLRKLFIMLDKKTVEDLEDTFIPLGEFFGGFAEKLHTEVIYILSKIAGMAVQVYMTTPLETISFDIAHTFCVFKIGQFRFICDTSDKNFVLFSKQNNELYCKAGNYLVLKDKNAREQYPHFYRRIYPLVSKFKALRLMVLADIYTNICYMQTIKFCSEADKIYGNGRLIFVSMNIGTCYGKTDQWDKAIEYFQKEKDRGFFSTGLYFNMAISSTENHCYQDALKYFRKILRFNPSEAIVILIYQRMARVYYLSGDYDAAIQILGDVKSLVENVQEWQNILFSVVQDIREIQNERDELSSCVNREKRAKLNRRKAEAIVDDIRKQIKDFIETLYYRLLSEGYPVALFDIRVPPVEFVRKKSNKEKVIIKDGTLIFNLANISDVREMKQICWQVFRQDYRQRLRKYYEDMKKERIVIGVSEYKARINREHFLVLGNLDGKNVVLDLGTGGGGVAIELKKEGVEEVFAVDTSKYVLDNARLNAESKEVKIHFALADALKLPFPNNSFDAVYAFLLSQYLLWPDRIKMLKEISRVLKEGGEAHFVGYREKWKVIFYWDGKEIPSYEYSLEWPEKLWRKHFKKNGFENIQFFYIEDDPELRPFRKIVAIKGEAGSPARPKTLPSLLEIKSKIRKNMQAIADEPLMAADEYKKILGFSSMSTKSFLVSILEPLGGYALIRAIVILRKLIIEVNNRPDSKLTWDEFCKICEYKKERWKFKINVTKLLSKLNTSFDEVVNKEFEPTPGLGRKCFQCGLDLKEEDFLYSSSVVFIGLRQNNSRLISSPVAGERYPKHVAKVRKRWLISLYKARRRQIEEKKGPGKVGKKQRIKGYKVGKEMKVKEKVSNVTKRIIPQIEARYRPESIILPVGFSVKKQENIIDIFEISSPVISYAHLWEITLATILLCLFSWHIFNRWKLTGNKVNRHENSPELLFDEEDSHSILTNKREMILIFLSPIIPGVFCAVALFMPLEYLGLISAALMIFFLAMGVFSYIISYNSFASLRGKGKIVFYSGFSIAWLYIAIYVAAMVMRLKGESYMMEIECSVREKLFRIVTFGFGWLASRHSTMMWKKKKSSSSSLLKEYQEANSGWAVRSPPQYQICSPAIDFLVLFYSASLSSPIVYISKVIFTLFRNNPQVIAAVVLGMVGQVRNPVEEINREPLKYNRQPIFCQMIIFIIGWLLPLGLVKIKEIVKGENDKGSSPAAQETPKVSVEDVIEALRTLAKDLPEVRSPDKDEQQAKFVVYAVRRGLRENWPQCKEKFINIAIIVYVFYCYVEDRLKKAKKNFVVAEAELVGSILEVVKLFKEVGLSLDWKENKTVKERIIDVSLMVYIIAVYWCRLYDMGKEVSWRIINDKELKNVIKFSDGESAEDGALFWIEVVSRALLYGFKKWALGHVRPTDYLDKVICVFAELILKKPEYTGKILNNVPWLRTGVYSNEEWVVSLICSLIDGIAIGQSFERIVSPIDKIGKVVAQLGQKRVFEIFYEIAFSRSSYISEKNKGLPLILAIYNASLQKAGTLIADIKEHISKAPPESETERRHWENEIKIAQCILDDLPAARVYESLVNEVSLSVLIPFKYKAVSFEQLPYRERFVFAIVCKYRGSQEFKNLLFDNWLRRDAEILKNSREIEDSELKEFIAVTEKYLKVYFERERINFKPSKVLIGPVPMPIALPIYRVIVCPYRDLTDMIGFIRSIIYGLIRIHAQGVPSVVLDRGLNQLITIVLWTEPLVEGFSNFYSKIGGERIRYLIEVKHAYLLERAKKNKKESFQEEDLWCALKVLKQIGEKTIMDAYLRGEYSQRMSCIFSEQMWEDLMMMEKAVFALQKGRIAALSEVLNKTRVSLLKKLGRGNISLGLREYIVRT
ncbi:MAG: methyltransferase domain-containing protein, partial [Candidatus Omnitrophota bacterium]